MEQRISGFRVEGTWESVVDHGDQISRILRELGSTAHPEMDPDAYKDALHDWEAWRPRATEDLDDDLRPRTAEQASVVEGEGEKRGQTTGEDLQRARKTLVAAGSHAHVETGLVRRLAEATRLTGRAIDTGFRRLTRRFEETIYEHLMTRMAPCYFDNPVISANLDRRAPGDDEYRFEININDDELKAKVSERVDKDRGEPALAARAPTPG